MDNHDSFGFNSKIQAIRYRFAYSDPFATLTLAGRRTRSPIK